MIPPLPAPLRAFFFSRVSARGFGMMRAAWGFVCLLVLLAQWRDAGFFYGPAGILPPELISQATRAVWRFSLLDGIQSPEAALALYLFLLLSLVFTTLGLFPRASTTVSVVLLFSFHERDPLVLGGGETLLRLIGAVLLVSPVLSAFSLQGLRARRARGPVLPELRMSIWPYRLLLWQMIVLYGTSLWHKLLGEMWLNGTAIAAVLHHPAFSRLPSSWVDALSPLSSLACYAVLALHAAWILLLVPRPLLRRLPLGIGDLPLKRIALCGGVVMHGLIFVLMDAGSFSLAILTAYLGLLLDEDFVAIRRSAVLLRSMSLHSVLRTAAVSGVLCAGVVAGMGMGGMLGQLLGGGGPGGGVVGSSCSANGDCASVCCSGGTCAEAAVCTGGTGGATGTTGGGTSSSGACPADPCAASPCAQGESCTPTQGGGPPCRVCGPSSSGSTGGATGGNTGTTGTTAVCGDSVIDSVTEDCELGKFQYKASNGTILRSNLCNVWDSDKYVDGIIHCNNICKVETTNCKRHCDNQWYCVDYAGSFTCARGDSYNPIVDHKNGGDPYHCYDNPPYGGYKPIGLIDIGTSLQGYATGTECRQACFGGGGAGAAGGNGGTGAIGGGLGGTGGGAGGKSGGSGGVGGNWGYTCYYGKCSLVQNGPLTQTQCTQQCGGGGNNGGNNGGGGDSGGDGKTCDHCSYCQIPAASWLGGLWRYIPLECGNGENIADLQRFLVVCATYARHQMCGGGDSGGDGGDGGTGGSSARSAASSVRSSAPNASSSLSSRSASSQHNSASSCPFIGCDPPPGCTRVQPFTDANGCRACHIRCGSSSRSSQASQSASFRSSVPSSSNASANPCESSSSSSSPSSSSVSSSAGSSDVSSSVPPSSSSKKPASSKKPGCRVVYVSAGGTTKCSPECLLPGAVWPPMPYPVGTPGADWYFCMRGLMKEPDSLFAVDLAPPQAATVASMLMAQGPSAVQPMQAALLGGFDPAVLDLLRAQLGGGSSGGTSSPCAESSSSRSASSASSASRASAQSASGGSSSRASSASASSPASAASSASRASAGSSRSGGTGSAGSGASGSQARSTARSDAPSSGAFSSQGIIVSAARVSSSFRFSSSPQASSASAASAPSSTPSVATNRSSHPGLPPLFGGSSQAPLRCVRSADCPFGACIDGLCTPTISGETGTFVPAPVSCRQTADCGDGQECASGACRCTSDEECPFGRCIGGTCAYRACRLSADCPLGACTDGLCRQPLTFAGEALASCGDGRVDAAEECDDGNRRNVDGCSAQCLSERGRCGDGIVQRLLDEQCERPGSAGCSLACRRIPPGCGDGRVDAGEECDGGTDNDDRGGGACRTDCSLPRCGDGARDAGEQCDDRNRVEGDGCSGVCRLERGAAQVLPGSVQGQGSWQGEGQGLGMIGYDGLPIAALSVRCGGDASCESGLCIGGTCVRCVRSTDCDIGRTCVLGRCVAVPAHAPVGDTGPASFAVLAAGAAGGWAWVRRRKR